MTSPATYGQSNVAMPPLNEVERDMIATAIAQATVRSQMLADECEPGSTLRQRHEAHAITFQRIGRKIAFPTDPKQW